LLRFPPAAHLACLLPWKVAALALALGSAGEARASTLYSIGEPTNEEQHHVELINRARANPTAEGIRLKASTDPQVLMDISYFKVDLNMMAAEFAALPVRPPLAINPKLMTAARGHSQDMFNRAFQGHIGSNGSTLSTRFAAVGYSAAGAENVYATAANSVHCHAGFQIDWGDGGTGGMQNPRGHRLSIHGAYREIGVGVILGNNTYNGNTVGPHVATQNFGSGMTANTAYVTGVVFHDLNGNDFYDPGEGLGGVTVQVEGSAYHAISAASGGYAVPVPTADAVRAVTFTGTEISAAKIATIGNGANVKVDLIVPYVPAVPAGPASPAAGRANAYAFSAVPGASGHEWKYATVKSVPRDPAENLTRVTVSSSGGYNLVQTNVKHAGSAAYRFAHPQFTDESLTYTGKFIAKAGATLSFRSRLGWATTTQVAKVQVSTDDALSWADVYSQAGNGGAGEAGFTLRSASLAAYVGKEIRIRFLYTGTGSRFPQTDPGVGWYVDEVDFTGLDEIENEVTQAASAATGFTFTPPAPGSYLIAVRPVFPGRKGHYGPLIAVTAIQPPPLTGYALWATGVESAHGLPAGALNDSLLGDHNKDGVSNLTAYALGLDPLAPSAHLVPRAVIQGGHLTLDYQVDTSKTDVTVTAQTSTNLVDWFPPGAEGAPSGWNDQLIATAGTIQTRRARIPLGNNETRFLRLGVTKH
jgi:hypothetical protein